MDLNAMNTRLKEIGAILYWMQQRDHRSPYQPEIQRGILAEGEWVVKLVSRRPKLGNYHAKRADGVGHTPQEAFDAAVHNYLNPFVWKPRATRPTLMDLDLELEL